MVRRILAGLGLALFAGAAWAAPPKVQATGGDSQARTYYVRWVNGDTGDGEAIPNRCAAWRVSASLPGSASLSLYALTTSNAAASSGTLLTTLSASAASVTTIETGWPFVKPTIVSAPSGSNVGEVWLYCAREARGGDNAFVDVRDFGAVCDGTTDDTAEIQAAIDAARASTSKATRVRIPRGTCRASQLIIKTGFWMEGDSESTALGTTASTIKQTEGTNLDLFLDDPTLPNNEYLHGIKMRNLQLRGADTPGTGAGIRLTNRRYAESAKFEALFVNDFGGPGIALQGGCEPCYLEDIHANGNGGPGIYLNRGNDDVNATFYLSHISGDDNTDALIEYERGAAVNGETVLIEGVKSECGPNQNQLYAVKLDTINGGAVVIDGLVHRANCAAGAAAIRAEGGASIPRLVWSGVDIDTSVEFWLSDAIGSNTVARTADSHWGVFGFMRGGSHLFQWTTSPQACVAGTKGATYYDTATNELKVCIDDGTPAYEVLGTGAAGSGNVIEDSTHVWVDPGESIQTACTNLNTALDAANSDGWLYVWGGTYSVTAPLTCNGASDTERMHIICMGGPVSLDTASNSGCRITAAADAGTQTTLSIAHADLSGFYVSAGDDASDVAVTCTDSCLVQNNALVNGDSANNPATKYVVRADATAATTPVVHFVDNLFEMTCSSASSECDGSTAMARIELGQTGSGTDNSLFRRNQFVWKGTVRAAPNKPATIHLISGDDHAIRDNYSELLWPATDTPLFIRYARDANTFGLLGYNTFQGSGDWGPSGIFDIRLMNESTGGAGDFKFKPSSFTWFDNDGESYGLTIAQYDDTRARFKVATDGDTEWGPGNASQDIQMQRRVTGNILEVQQSGPGGGAFALDNLGSTAPGTCTVNRQAQLWYDLTLKDICICDDATGSYLWRQVDGGGVGSNTDCDP